MWNGNAYSQIWLSKCTQLTEHAWAPSFLDVCRRCFQSGPCLGSKYGRLVCDIRNSVFSGCLERSKFEATSSATRNSSRNTYIIQLIRICNIPFVAYFGNRNGTIWFNHSANIANQYEEAKQPSSHSSSCTKRQEQGTRLACISKNLNGLNLLITPSTL